ncbi:hypothetical protein DFH09DRAFT_162725 [Mycena vulgaris]|nr:hypothetical protein DFH09DRAFT_162725 [Mycena vulgaris]
MQLGGTQPCSPHFPCKLRRKPPSQVETLLAAPARAPRCNLVRGTTDPSCRPYRIPVDNQDEIFHIYSQPFPSLIPIAGFTFDLLAANLAAAIFESCLYGILLILFVSTIFWARRRRGSQAGRRGTRCSSPLFIGVVALFTMVTAVSRPPRPLPTNPISAQALDPGPLPDLLCIHPPRRQ